MMRQRKSCGRYGGFRRRTWIWAGILAVVLALFGSLTHEFGPGAIVSRAFLVGLGLLFWALAILAWDLAAVFVDYVSRSRHLGFLERRWGIETRRARLRGAPPPAPAGRGPAEPPAAPTGLWWRDLRPRR